MIEAIIDEIEPVEQDHGTDRYYDPDRNITVVTEPGGDKIVTVHIGPTSGG